ncbi:MAG TPA: phosphate/phosphite/phosphonate ABC transporter substrate-binding protein [Xanthomonadaceae bacterium]|nr:phosphate/phosphite/phosphonate ABC transporter substrate-binding protein [Xanthomonadaceae bacterium]
MRLSLPTLLLPALVFAISTAAPAQSVAPPQDTLVLGRVSDNPKAHYEQLKPLLDYAVERLRPLGIRHGRVLMARDRQQMASYLRRGRVDWVTETAGTAMDFAQRAGATPLVVTERNGVSSYHTVFFARRDSGIASLQDLAGRSIAFQNPSSTSAYYAPAAALLAAGLQPEILLSPQDTPSPGTIGYVFARSEGNIATWVHKRLVDAGAFSNLDWASLDRLPASYSEDLVVFHRTAPFPRGIELVRAGLDPRISERLQSILLSAHEDPEAREPMLRFFGTTRFLPVDEPTGAELGSLTEGVRRVRSALE